MIKQNLTEKKRKENDEKLEKSMTARKNFFQEKQ